MRWIRSTSRGGHRFRREKTSNRRPGREDCEGDLTAPFSGTIVQLKVRRVMPSKPMILSALLPIRQSSFLRQARKDELTEMAFGMPVSVDINNAGQFDRHSEDAANCRQGMMAIGRQSMEGGQWRSQEMKDSPEDYLIVQLDQRYPEEA